MITLPCTGCDPGVNGCLVTIHPSGKIQYWDMPVIRQKGKPTQPDRRALTAIIHEVGGGIAVVESVHLQPADAGALRRAEVLIRIHECVVTLLEAFEFEVVRLEPVQWRSQLGLAKGMDKAALVSEALKRFPDCSGWVKYARGQRNVAKHDRAEALLLASLGRQIVEERRMAA